MDLDVAAAERPAFWQPTIHRDHEAVVLPGLSVVHDLDGERARQTIIGARPTEGGRVAHDHWRCERHAVALRAAGVIGVLQAPAYLTARRRPHDEPEVA